MKNIRDNADVWMRAAVLGSIWASIEIIVGNFLHGFRMPFTGEILTFFAIYFLTAASVRWKIKGLVWRAGLICAMMKFFTPGVKVFGPIIGIVLESFMLEIILRVSGMNLFGFIIGGGITLCLPLVQKLVNLLIAYGWNLVVVFDKSIEFLFKIINVQNTDSSVVLIFLFAVNFAFGALAAILGYRSGRRKTEFKGIDTMYKLPDIYGSTAFEGNASRTFISIALNAAAIVTALIFIKDFLPAVSAFIAVYTGFVLYKYPNSRRMFRNRKLWVQIAVFTALTTLVLAFVMKSGFDKALMTGAEMFMRVLLITVGFNAISNEIARPEFKNFLRSKLNRNFSNALNLAFAAVPEIINTSKGITSILNPGRFINELTYLMEVWHERFKSNSVKDIIITGAQGAGKTAYLKKLITERTCGVFSEVIYENGERTGYDAVLTGSGERLPLCRTGHDSGLMLGKFGFYEDTFRSFTDKILNDTVCNADVIIIDEIGLLEKEGKGWHDLMLRAAKKENVSLVLSVRADAVDYVKVILKPREFEVVRVGQAEEI